MHILHVIESLEFGGAEKVVIHLANRLSEKHKVTVCLIKYRGDLVGELSEKINVISLDLGEGIHFDLPRKLGNVILKNAIDIVNTHNWAVFFESYLAVKKVKMAKVILTVHGPYTEYGPGIRQLIKKKIRHFFERRAAKSKYIGKIVTVSDSIQDYIISEIGIPREKLLTIHNGIGAIDCQSVGNDDVLRLISVGRLATIKNHKLMIDALNLCVLQNRNIYLTIVGDGPEREYLEHYVRDLELTDHIEFLGFRNDIKELITAHDVFVLSSDYEGISIALLEAMSLSRPTIATNVGGIPETIQHQKSGLIVPKGDVERFSEAILKLGKSREWQKEMGSNAREYFQNNFHEDIMLDKYVNLYRSCVEMN